MKAIQYCITYLILLFIAGCAFSVYDVKVGYQYQASDEIPINLSRVTLGVFEDTRNIENKRMIIHKQNLYGDTTTGGAQAEKPLSEIIRDAVAQVLQAYSSSNVSKSLVLTGELVDFNAEVIKGYWSSQYKGRLTQKFQLKDINTDEIVWRDSFTGVATVPSKDGPEGLFRATLDKVISIFIEDEFFLQQLNKQQSERI